MHVLMIITQYAPVIGGAERQAQAVGEALVRRGHTVTVLTQPQQDVPEEEHVEGVRVLRRLKATKLGPLWGLTYLHSAHRELNRLAPEADIIHCHQFYFYTAVAGRRRRKAGPPVVCKAVNTGLRSDIGRMSRRFGGDTLMRWSRNLDRVIATTGAIEREMLAHHFRHEQIVRIPNFVDTDLFKPSPESSPGQEWLYLGRLDSAKGPDLLLKAMARLGGEARSAQLVMAGDGPMRHELEQRAQLMNLQSRVRFVNAAADPKPLLAQARGLILPSRAEGLSNVLLEALACGKPVIATDVGGTREVLEDDQPLPHGALNKGCAWTPHGLLVRPFDEEGLAIAIETAESAFDRMIECGKAAVGMVRRRFAKDLVLDKLENLYKDLITECG